MAQPGSGQLCVYREPAVGAEPDPAVAQTRHHKGASETP